MNLANLMHLAAHFNIDPNKIGFHGEHDVVYLDIDEEDMGFLLTENEFMAQDEEIIEAFYEEHGIFIIEGCWGFYS